MSYRKIKTLTWEFPLIESILLFYNLHYTPLKIVFFYSLYQKIRCGLLVLYGWRCNNIESSQALLFWAIHCSPTVCHAVVIGICPICFVLTAGNLQASKARNRIIPDGLGGDVVTPWISRWSGAGQTLGLSSHSCTDARQGTNPAPSTLHRAAALILFS